ELHEVEIGGGDHSFADQPFAHPVDESAPELASDKNDRNLPALAGLYQRQTLGQLVDGAETSRHHDVRRRETHEHHLAREKITEVDADVLITVAGLLVRQQDVEPDGRGAPAVRAAVCRFHRSRPAPGYYGEAGIRQKPRNPFRLFEVRMIGLNARAAEHAYRGPHAAQAL